MAGSQRGARSAFGDDDGRKKKGFPWWLLGLLAVALIAILLLVRACGDDGGEEAGSGSGAGTTAAQSQPQEAAPTGGAVADEDGTLIASGQRLLPVQPGVDLAQYAGQESRGTRVQVQEVVQDEGFFVGTSEQDRVYVEFGGDVGEAESGSGAYDPEVGDEVDLTGPVRPSPEDPEQTLNLDAEDARQVKQQGAYVNADRVEKAG